MVVILIGREVGERRREREKGNEIEMDTLIYWFEGFGK